jgi:HrpA-like RNA helicase
MEEKLDKLHFIPGKLDRNHIKDILDLVKRESFSVLISPTGSGKSTLVPPAFAVCLNAKVFCSQPTIVAASETASIVREWYPDLSIGTAFEGDIKYKKSTDIVYCTSGHLKNKLISYAENKDYYVDFCDVIIVDEAHNGTLDNEVIMGLWKLLLKRGIESGKDYTIPRLLLASATLSMDVIPFKITENFVKIEFESYPVKIVYHDQDYKITDNTLYTDVADVVFKMNNEIDVDEDRMSKWLIFCPGKGEVEIVYRRLEELLPDAEIFMVHSGNKEKDENQQYLFNKNIAKGTRAFVVATNVFETSVTLDNCDGVFDTLTEKNMTQSSNGSNKLLTEFISKSSSIQRKGRTGRVGKGFYYRMCSEEFYKNIMIERRPPEIERLNLSLIFLMIFRSGIQPEELFGNRVKKDKRENAIVELKYFELIKMKDKKLDEDLKETVKEISINKKKKDLNKVGEIMKQEFELTEKGFFVSSFELSLRNGCLLWEWVKEGYPIFPGLVAVALIEGCSDDSYLYFPPKKDMDNKTYSKLKNEYYKENFIKWESETQLGFILNIWKDFSDELKSLSYRSSELREWCMKNSIREKVFATMLKDLNRYISKIEKMGYDVKIGKFTNKNLLNKLLEPFERSYNDKIVISLAGKKNTFRGKNGGEVYTLDSKNIPENITSQNYRKVIVISSLTIGKDKFEKNLITQFHPLDIFELKKSTEIIHNKNK